jgi:hypothetical protein
MKTLVEIEGTLVEIKKDKNNKLHARELSVDEQFETSVLEQNIAQSLDNEFNKLSNEVFDEVRRSFKTSLKENLLKTIGFNTSFGKWEIDHCNGRQSIVTNLLSQRVKEDFCTSFDTVLKPEIDGMILSLKKEIMKEYKDLFMRYVRDELRQSSQEAARNFLNSLISKEITKTQKEVVKRFEAAFVPKEED